MKLSTIVGMVFLFSSAAALAHEGGHGPIQIASCASPNCTKKEIQDAAQKVRDNYVNGGELDKSWKDAKLVSSEIQAEKGKEQVKFWNVNYLNKTEKNKEKQNLFIFITTDGNLLGASHKKM